MTQELVKTIFEYKEGKLFWKINAAFHIKKGNEAGHMSDQGYLRVTYKGKSYKIHRLIYLWHHGYMPPNVDHKDQNKLNNNIDNLRDATISQNNANIPKRINCSSIYKGVTYRSKINKWITSISINGKMKHVGIFTTEKEAALAYNIEAIKHYKEYACLNIIN